MRKSAKAASHISFRRAHEKGSKAVKAGYEGAYSPPRRSHRVPDRSEADVQRRSKLRAEVQREVERVGKTEPMTRDEVIEELSKVGIVPGAIIHGGSRSEGARRGWLKRKRMMKPMRFTPEQERLIAISARRKVHGRGETDFADNSSPSRFDVGMKAGTKGARPAIGQPRGTQALSPEEIALLRQKAARSGVPTSRRPAQSYPDYQEQKAMYGVPLKKVHPGHGKLAAHRKKMAADAKKYSLKGPFPKKDIQSVELVHATHGPVGQVTRHHYPKEHFSASLHSGFPGFREWHEDQKHLVKHPSARAAMNALIEHHQALPKEKKKLPKTNAHHPDYFKTPVKDLGDQIWHTYS